MPTPCSSFPASGPTDPFTFRFDLRGGCYRGEVRNKLPIASCKTQKGTYLFFHCGLGYSLTASIFFS